MFLKSVLRHANTLHQGGTRTIPRALPMKFPIPQTLSPLDTVHDCPQTTFPCVAVGKGYGNARLFQMLLYIQGYMSIHKLHPQGNQISYKSPLHLGYNNWRTSIRNKTLEISKLTLVRRFHCMLLNCYKRHT